MNKQDLISALKAASARMPQLRLCQLIFNALDKQPGSLARTKDGTPRDLFYIDDETLFKALNEYP